MMTLLVRAAWRLLRGREGGPKLAFFVGVIVISSLVSGVGHLPVAHMILHEATAALTLYGVEFHARFLLPVYAPTGNAL